MKKNIIISLIVAVSINLFGQDIETHGYNTDLIVEELNKENINKTNVNFIYMISNNNTVKKRIEECSKDLYSGHYLFPAFKYIYDERLDQFEKYYTDKKIKNYKKANAKGILYTMKAFINKDINKKSFKQYKELALTYLENKNLFYYLIYKFSYIYEDYATAYEYLNYIYLNDYYSNIEEEIVDTTLLGTKKYYENKEYETSWILALKGLEKIDNLNYDNFIQKRIILKEFLVKNSKELLKEKTKDKNLYIITETKKYLK